MKFKTYGLLAVFAVLPLHAGMPNASCSQPFVFRDARVNVIVLPYVNKDASSPELERTSAQLTLLLQQTILFSALKYPSIGTVRMVPSSPARVADCQSGIVAAKILGQTPGAMQQLGPDAAAILVWGQVYKEGDRIYLCSYARLVKRGGDIVMESTGGGHGIFSAHLPSAAVTFPVRAITTGLLDQIGSAFRSSAIAHRDPSLTSPGFELPMDPLGAYPYQVVEVNADGWMHIRGMQGSPSGWIYAREPLQNQTLVENLPELEFVDGAIGYLEFAKAPDSVRIRALAQPSLAKFAEAGGTRDTGLAVAMAKSMLAMMFERDAALRQRGYQFARDAVALVPYNADARNLELVYRLDLSSQDIYQPGKWAAVAEEFAQAAALGPGKKYILDNLDSFYRGVLAVSGLANGGAAVEIQNRRRQLALLGGTPPAQ